MNITISKELHEYLQTIVIESVVFGSRAISVVDESSDTDYMHLIECHKVLATCPIYAGHWLQYKETDVNGNVIADHVYSTIPQFIHGVINAESMIPWEILAVNHGRSGIVKVADFDVMNNFKSARGFLGLARRDLKDSTKLFNSEIKKSKKKLKFAIRSLQYALSILEKHSIINSVEIRNLVFDESVFDNYQDYIVVIKRVEKYVDTLRDVLIEAHNQRKIPYSVSMETIKELHKTFLCDMKFLDDNVYSDMMLDLYTKAAIENDYK